MGLASPWFLSEADTTLPQMFPDRMARKPSAYGLLSLVVLSYVVTALAIRLPEDISRLIPGCAQECFISFLVLSYGTGDDGEIPPLDYLCSNYGDSEFTVGEGAVQCLVAEKSVGSCSQKEADGEPLRETMHRCPGLTLRRYSDLQGPSDVQRTAQRYPADAWSHNGNPDAASSGGQRPGVVSAAEEHTDENENYASAAKVD